MDGGFMREIAKQYLKEFDELETKACNEDKKFIDGCKKLGTGIEIEAYDISHINNIMDLIKMGAFDQNERLHFSLVLGIGGGTPAKVKSLLNLVHEIPEGSTWQVVTVSKYHLRTTLIAMCMGGNVRTGLEDTIYYKKNEPVQSNAQLVKRMVRLAKEIGREPATVDEAREELGLK